MKRVIVMMLLGLGVALGAMLPSLAQSVGDESSPIGEQSPPGPDVTDAEITVTPATDLVDRQQVLVTGRLFDPPNTNAGVLMCKDVGLGFGSVDSCDLSTLVITSTDSDGNLEADLTVARTIDVGGETIDCADLDACVVAAGTIAPTGISATEGALAKVTFDPAVDPVPPLTVDVTIDNVTDFSISGTLTCSADAEVYFDGQVSQNAAVPRALSYFGYTSLPCSPTPSEWAMVMQSNEGRLAAGEAQVFIYAYASTQFDSTTTTVDKTVTIEDTNDTGVVSVPGEFITVDVAGVRGAGQNSQILLDVTCAVPAEYVSLSFNLTQYLGRDSVSAYGYATLTECGRTERVAVRLNDSNRRLGPGPARVNAYASGSTTTSDEPRYDTAQTSAPVRIIAQVPRSADIPDAVSGAFVEVTRTTPRAVIGFVTCDVSSTVDLDLALVQQRATRTIAARSHTSVECDGRTRFRLRIPQSLRTGPAVALIYAYGHREIEVDDLSYPITEYLWEDLVGWRFRARR